MASVLSLAPHSPLLMPCSNESYGRSCSSFSSHDSALTVQRRRPRKSSSGSFVSITSYYAPSLTRHITDTSQEPPPDPRDQERSRSSNLSLPLHHLARLDTASHGPSRRLHLVNVPEGREAVHSPVGSGTTSDSQDDSIASGCTLSHSVVLPPDTKEEVVGAPLQEDGQKAFHRWVSTLRRKKAHKPQSVIPRTERWTLDDFEPRAFQTPPKRPSLHKKSDSCTSSLGFVTAVKSATVTLASASIAPLSRRTTRWMRGHQRSSLVSGSEVRASVDSERSFVDEAARLRSRKRREKVEELIRTEESYIADLKALINAYFTLLVPQTAPAVQARASVQKTVGDILHLHDDLLGELHRVVPFSEYDQTVARAPKVFPGKTHVRWHSAEAVLSRVTPKKSALTTVQESRRSLNISRSSEQEPVVLFCSPQTAAAVAQVFNKHMQRFSVYEEYGAKYEMMQRNIEAAQSAIATWPDYDRAIETLSATVNPIKSREANRRKAMTPIQRITRYELLFNDLCRLTPSCDNPESHGMLEDVLCRLNETCQGINQAKDNPEKMRKLETSWRLQDRLAFSDQVPRSLIFQQLGQHILCGSLHIAYRSKERIKGRYVICVLYQSCLLLADADKEATAFSVVAAIPLATAAVEEADNGKGLQCHTAPYSWKLVFEHGARMYETILTACTAAECYTWRACIGDRVAAETNAVSDGSAKTHELQSSLLNDMKSIGKAFGKAGSFVRRMSVHRSATLGPTTDMNQVIIKNSQAIKDVLDHPSTVSLPIPRSQSVMTPSHVQTLAPRRSDRSRLETLLVDVWTRDLLAYPGMTARRSDNPIKASANHVMRKFSMASIASSLPGSKRSASYTSVTQARTENAAPAKTSVGPRAPLPARGPPLVDFHNAPDAFLPEDFKLQDPSTKRRKMGLRTFTMTALDRPRSPFWGGESKTGALTRASSVRNVATALGRTTKEDRPDGITLQRTKTPLVPEAPVDAVAKENNIAAKMVEKGRGKLLRLFG